MFMLMLWVPRAWARSDTRRERPKSIVQMLVISCLTKISLINLERDPIECVFLPIDIKKQVQWSLPSHHQLFHGLLLRDVESIAAYLNEGYFNQSLLKKLHCCLDFSLQLSVCRRIKCNFKRQNCRKLATKEHGCDTSPRATFMTKTCALRNATSFSPSLPAQDEGVHLFHSTALSVFAFVIQS